MERNLEIVGSCGKISMVLNKPELADGARCPVVILMHGFMANKRLEPLKTIARELEKEGIAALRFDFDGHGKSGGRFCDMTVETELDDAMRVYEYAASLDFAGKIAFVGHSQGGVVAGMTAGRLGAEKVACIVQLAAAAVLKDDALHGVLMGKHYDPANPPESLRVFFHKVGRRYFEVARNLPIYEQSSAYEGPVLLLHGKQDSIVPPSYSERYHEVYKNSSIKFYDGENHILSKRRDEVVSDTVAFLRKELL